MSAWKPPTSSEAAKIAAQRKKYLAAFPPKQRRTLKMMRSAILEVAPDAVEIFSYGIPGFRLHSERLLWYAGFQAHTSMYPVGAAIRAKLGAALKPYKGSTGTVQFPIDAPPSPALVKRIVRARIAQMGF